MSGSGRRTNMLLKPEEPPGLCFVLIGELSIKCIDSLAAGHRSIQNKGCDRKRGKLIGKSSVFQWYCCLFYRRIEKQHRFIFAPNINGSSSYSVEEKCCSLRDCLVFVNHNNVFGIV